MKLIESEKQNWFACMYMHVSNVNVNVDRVGIEIYDIQQYNEYIEIVNPQNTNEQKKNKEKMV